MNWIQRSITSLLGIKQPYYFEEWGNNDTFILDPKTDFGSLQSEKDKIGVVFTNPAVLKVFKLQCDMFSLGKVYVYKDGKPKKNDPFLKLIRKPNPFQYTSQFLWDFMFWKMLGNDYLYVDSDVVNSDTNKMYFLDISKITFPQEAVKYKDRIILSSATEQQVKDLLLSYTYSDGTSQSFKWGRIEHITDISNGLGNWFKGASAIDALYQVVANSKAGIGSKNINVRYAGKYMVAGQADPKDVNLLPMGEDEKNDIETKMNGPKTVHAVKSMIDIKRFVQEASIISELDTSYWDDYFKIGSMYGIPKDVLEASLKGATFENQEKARGAHVDYTLSPAAQQLTNCLNSRFGYDDKEIIISWDHLPFTQVFAKDKATTEKLKSEALLNLMKAGVKVEEINTILDTEFTELDYEPAKRSNTSGQDQNSTGQGAGQPDQAGVAAES